eukprot:Gb_31803 [translate_table: standard]
MAKLRWSVRGLFVVILSTGLILLLQTASTQYDCVKNGVESVKEKVEEPHQVENSVENSKTKAEEAVAATKEKGEGAGEGSWYKLKSLVNWSSMKFPSKAPSNAVIDYLACDHALIAIEPRTLSSACILSRAIITFALEGTESTTGAADTVKEAAAKGHETDKKTAEDLPGAATSGVAPGHIPIVFTVDYSYCI